MRATMFLLLGFVVGLAGAHDDVRFLDVRVPVVASRDQSLVGMCRVGLVDERSCRWACAADLSCSGFVFDFSDEACPCRTSSVPICAFPTPFSSTSPGDDTAVVFAKMNGGNYEATGPHVTYTGYEPVWAPGHLLSYIEVTTTATVVDGKPSVQQSAVFAIGPSTFPLSGKGSHRTRYVRCNDENAAVGSANEISPPSIGSCARLCSESKDRFGSSCHLVQSVLLRPGDDAAMEICWLFGSESVQAVQGLRLVSYPNSNEHGSTTLSTTFSSNDKWNPAANYCNLPVWSMAPSSTPPPATTARPTSTKRPRTASTTSAPRTTAAPRPTVAPAVSSLPVSETGPQPGATQLDERNQRSMGPTGVTALLSGIVIVVAIVTVASVLVYRRRTKLRRRQLLNWQRWEAAGMSSDGFVSADDAVASQV